MIEALLKIDERKVSALPVVDMEGAAHVPRVRLEPYLISSHVPSLAGSLKGNISATDISRLGLSAADQPEEMLQKLFVPVAHFLTERPVTCTMDDSIDHLLDLVVPKR